MGSTRSVVVVGAGSAGSVLVRRLLDAGLTVQLLEAGGEDTNPAIADPARAGELWHSAQDWDHFTVPQPGAHGRRLHIPRGKVLGGSHALNAMIWVRGAPADYDHWAALGNDGWSWADVEPVFEAIERFTTPAADADAVAPPGGRGARGLEGLLDVTDDYPLAPIHQAVIDAGVQTGLEHNPDYNGDHQDGIAQEQVTVRGGRRLSTWTAYVGPRTDHPALTVETGCWVHRVVVEDGRAVGVEYEQDGETRVARADEVVLCAGALGSPRVLLRSGVGPAEELAALGIDVVADVPGVGKNLHDHLLAPVVLTTEPALRPPTTGVSPTQTHWFWRSRDGLDRPDTQPIVFSVPMLSDGQEGPSEGLSLLAGIVAPTSRGSVTLSGPGPHDPLLVDTAALATPEDVAALVASVRQCRAVGAAPALAEAWGAREVLPGPGVGDDDEALEAYVRSSCVTYHHVAGSCAMGPGPLGVVDHRLRVRGVEGLRVADASVMPRITTGNTNAPSVLIGEMAARFVVEA